MKVGPSDPLDDVDNDRSLVYNPMSAAMDDTSDDESPKHTDIENGSGTIHKKPESPLSGAMAFEEEDVSHGLYVGGGESTEESDPGDEVYDEAYELSLATWKDEEIKIAAGDPRWAQQHAARIASLKLQADKHEAKIAAIVSGTIELGADSPVGRKGQEELGTFLRAMPIFVSGTALGQVMNSDVQKFVDYIIPRLQRKKFYKNTMAIRKGAEANEMFFIESGCAEVYLEEPDDQATIKVPPVATLKSGTCFGEAALLSPEVTTRNAFIRAKLDMDVYVLTGNDFRAALRAVPIILNLFRAKTSSDNSEREEHFRRYQDGGGNFKKGFRVKLKNNTTAETLRAEVNRTLEGLFDEVPKNIPKEYVESLLMAKIEEIADLQDKLSYDPGAEGHDADEKQGPMTQREKRMAFTKTLITAFLFFSVCFTPFMAVQHHAEEILIATQSRDPAVIELTHYSEYRLEVVGKMAAWPHNGIHETASHHGEPEEHNRRRMLKHVGPASGLMSDRRRTQTHERPPPSPTSHSEAPPAPSHNDVHPPDGLPAVEEMPTEMSYDQLTITPLVVRASEEFVEAIANGMVNLTHAELESHRLIVLDREPATKLSAREKTLRLDFDMSKLLALGHLDEYHRVEHGLETSGDEKIYLLFTTTSPVPVPLSVQVHDLGPLGAVQEVVAVVILMCTFAMIVFEVMHHALVAMFGSYVVLLCLAVQHRMPSIEEVVMQMDHGTLALLWGMMIIVGVTAKTGVFEWCAVRLYEISGGQPFRLMVLVSVFDIVLSAFLDNVTTMLLLAPVCVQLCAAVKMDPRPFLMALACFGNIGGTATMIGDPPNIIIGNMLSEYVNFNDFIVYLGTGVLFCIGPSFLFTKWFFRNEEGWETQLTADVDQLKRDNPIKNMRLLVKTGAMLCCVIFGFFMHPVSHIDPTFVAIAGAIAVFMLDNPHDGTLTHLEGALHKVEWDTLIFFAALFVLVEGLGEMGLLRAIAAVISELIESFQPENQQMMAIILVSWVSAVTSAFIDNIPFTTTMIPVIRQIAEEIDVINIEPLIWSLAFGSCLGGMGTLIGASDNVVMAGIAEKAGFHVSFLDFMKIGFPLMVICVFISTSWLLALHYAGVWPTGLEGDE